VELTLGDTVVTAEVADDEQERATGLMYRKTLEPDQGMLFVYGDEHVRDFWMKNTTIPLSIAFINEEAHIVSIRDMAPMMEASTSSVIPARYALEMEQGWFTSHDVRAGQAVGGIPLEEGK
jgi:uncharacterized membrane protein (UPF0127 family)